MLFALYKKCGTCSMSLCYLLTLSGICYNYLCFLVFLRYERHFTPNVSLAPSSNKSSNDDDEESDQKDRIFSSETSCPNQESSRKSSNASSKFEGERRGDMMEYDMPTDTDDSSIESPTDSEYI